MICKNGFYERDTLVVFSVTLFAVIVGVFEDGAADGAGNGT